MSMHCPVGWSDLQLFTIFEIGHIAAEFNYIKIGCARMPHMAHARRIFFFFITESLQIDICFEKLKKKSSLLLK